MFVIFRGAFVRIVSVLQDVSANGGDVGGGSGVGDGVLMSFAALPAEVRAYSNLMYSDCILILVVLF